MSPTKVEHIGVVTRTVQPTSLHKCSCSCPADSCPEDEFENDQTSSPDPVSDIDTAPESVSAPESDSVLEDKVDSSALGTEEENDDKHEVESTPPTKRPSSRCELNR